MVTGRTAIVYATNLIQIKSNSNINVIFTQNDNIIFYFIFIRVLFLITNNSCSWDYQLNNYLMLPTSKKFQKSNFVFFWKLKYSKSYKIPLNSHCIGVANLFAKRSYFLCSRFLKNRIPYLYFKSNQSFLS